MPVYDYTGTATRYYMDYVDEDTDQLLIAEIGNSYVIRSPSALPVPPPDGYWQEQQVAVPSVTKAKTPVTTTDEGEVEA